MSALRRLVAPLMALLGMLVAGQMLDVLPCADEGASPTHVTHAETGDDHGSTEGGCAPGGEGMPDCLCHVLFAPTTAVPVVAEAGEALRPPYAPYAGRGLEPAAVPVVHVPIG